MATPKPLPRLENFEKLAYGMFIHWGLYSQLGRGEWVQYLENIDITEYAKLKDSFYANEFDARAIARLAKEAGMKYICLTTRHHEGFSLYDTKGLTDFDALHSPAGRDLAAEFAEGCRQEGIVPFFYHTTLDWYQESFKNNFKQYIDFLCASIEILCRNYGKVGGFWFDGNWSKPDADWQESRLYAIIRRYQPDAIIVNNTGLHAKGAVGHPEIDCVTFEQGRPEPMNREGMVKYLSGEMCQTMNTHWGLGTNDFKYLSPKEIIENLCACRKVGANYLLNVGPTATGKIPEYEACTLRRVGEWVRMHSAAIYNGKPYIATNGEADFVLKADNKLYIFIHNLGVGGHLNVTTVLQKSYPKVFAGIDRQVKKVKWLDNGQELDFIQDKNGLLAFNGVGYPYGTNLVVRVAEVLLD
jgi:alpha-L-fucosidase